MKDKAFWNSLRELAWRRKLTDAERAGPDVSSEMRSDLEAESRLSEALERLPNAPVPSNFTARVFQAVEKLETPRPRAVNGSWIWRVLVPRAAVVTAVVAIAGLGIHRHELNVRRAALARSVVLVAATQPLPSVDALKNFNAIQRMSQPRADEELLALLK